MTVQAAFGQGVVTSFVLQSDNLDEIDWEWLGGDTKQVQSNYFGKGDTTTYDRGAYHDVANPQTSTHTYSIDWTKDHVQWIIDGVTVRELKYADAQGGSRFPQTPMQLRLGTWVAGRKDAPKGTVEWAGGYTDFSQGPFLAYYKDIKITDYSKGATKYSWKEGSDGSYQSINIIKDGNDSDDETTSSSSAKPSSTKASSTDAPKTSSADKPEKTASASATKSEGSATGSATATASKTETSANESAAPTSTGGSGSGSGEGESEGAESGSGDAPPSETDIPQAGAFKVGASAAVMCAGLFFGLML